MKLWLTAIIVVGSLLTLIAKRFWGRQALERKLGKKYEELGKAQEKRQAILGSLGLESEYYAADVRCEQLSKAIYYLRRRLGKNP